MLAESVEKWTEQWKKQGQIERVEGRVEGEVAVLARQLTKRFGPLDDQTTARLKTATLDQLDVWADRIEYFSPSWTAFQADRGRGFSVIVDGVSD